MSHRRENHWTNHMEDEMTVPIPFNIREAELVYEPRLYHRNIHTELEWLVEYATEEEIPRILTAAIALWHHQGASDASFAACLETAVIWERG